MADHRLEDARQDARSAVDSYDALSRNDRMDQHVLADHARRFHGALESLVDATADDAGLAGQRESARDALSEFDDSSSFGSPQQVRRACYVLRSKTKSMLDALETE